MVVASNLHHMRRRHFRGTGHTDPEGYGAAGALAEALPLFWTSDRIQTRNRRQAPPGHADMRVMLELRPMTDTSEGKPVFVLVDDHIHSARLLSRTLRDAANPAQVVWLGDARRAKRTLNTIFAERPEQTPDMLIVDIKAHSTATQDFISEIRDVAEKAGVPIAAIAPSLDAPARNALITAGANGVFERHHDLDTYRREMAHLTTFWVRETATWPIRA